MKNKKNNLIVITLCFTIFLNFCTTSNASMRNGIEPMYAIHEAAAKIIVTDYDDVGLFTILERGIQNYGKRVIEKIREEITIVSKQHEDFYRTDFTQIRETALFDAMYNYKISSTSCISNNGARLRKTYMKLYIKYLKQHYNIF